MRLPIKDQKILWVRAAGMCSFPDCKKKLIVQPDIESEEKLVGEIAHIFAKSKKGPRGVQHLTKKLINTYTNTILLCPDHHRLVDLYPGEYPPELLMDFKDQHEIWVQKTLRDRTEGIGWKVIIQEANIKIDKESIIKALNPDFPQGKIVRLSSNNTNWLKTMKNLTERIKKVIKSTKNPRFAIFSLAKISAAIFLGFLLRKIRVKYIQYDRDNQIWSWPKNFPRNNLSLKISELFREINTSIKEIIIKVSISSKIRDTQISGLELPIDNKIEIYSENPKEDWLNSEDQVINAGKLFRDVLANVRHFLPNLNKIHLFYAGPTSIAIAMGKQINPTINPPIQLYEFNTNMEPNYSRSIAIGE